MLRRFFMLNRRFPLLKYIFYGCAILIVSGMVLWPASASASLHAQAPLQVIPTPTPTSTPTSTPIAKRAVGPKLTHEQAKAWPLLPHVLYRGTSIVLVHGLNGGDSLFGSASNGSASMSDCGTYWSDARLFLASRWSGDVRQVSYYRNEVNRDGSACAENGNAQDSYSANLQDSLYQARCAGFSSANAGTNNENIDHLSCLLAWYLYYNFGQNHWDEVLVGHSMGGLIIRRAMELVELHTVSFPATIGHVTDAITFDTPQGGVFGANLACGNCLQGQEMRLGSALLEDLARNARHPDSGGNTDWTLIGSACDLLIGGSALMMDANHKVWYDGLTRGTCYNHGGAIHDVSSALDGGASHCDTAQSFNGTCAFWFEFPQGSGWSYQLTGYPHGLLEMWYAIESSSW
ncbi:hypothetical protein [Dictyobacter arantiisoli]|uniref:DUF676 domain-containing protein n=1 Tax=Dictyobacter arantiisoli TaxID=2014874 RepID=A0A5A5TDE8_9CHLR|nr:hypothetical protein [Dictyobacter arantiisoli]GCF09560.1 hypothetical protein KDI_31240 [Dictyobacter arantiisoli]